MLPFSLKKDNASKIILLLLLIPVLLTLPEIFIYQGITQAKLGFSVENIFLGVFLLFLLMRVFGYSAGKKFFAVYSYIILPILIGFTIVLNLLDTFTYPNFTFSTFHIQAPALFDMAILFLLFSIPFFNFSFVKRNWRWSLFTAGMLGFYLYVFLKWRVSPVFYELDGEDGILEYLQVSMYLLSSFFALLSFKIVRALKVSRLLKITWLTILALSAIGFILIAFEEISWGQRLFGIETPETLQGINKQNETNIHNIEGVFDKVYWGYLLVGLYGFSSWALRYTKLSFLGHRIYDYLRPVLSRWYLMPFFLVMIGYIIWRFNGPETGYHLWEEASEVFFVTGVSLLFYRGYIHMKQYKKK